MTDETSDLDDVILGLLAEKGQRQHESGEHLSAKTLTAYQAKELSSGEEEQVQSHLAVCRHCTEMLSAFEELLHPLEVGAAPMADFEAAADWQRLWSRLRRFRRQLTYAVAAVFCLAVVGLSIYALTREPLSREPKRFKTLESRGSTRGPAEAIAVVELPVTLVLKSEAESSYPEYRAELLDDHGRLIRELPHLQGSQSFEVEIPLGRRDLKPGKYRVNLLGVTDRGADPVGEYVFKVKS